METTVSLLFKPFGGVPAFREQHRLRCLSADNDCDDEFHVTTIKKSNPVMTAIPETCSGERYPQACYHYYSAIHNYDFVESTFTCGDEIKREPGTATAERTKQHKDKKWQHYTQAVYRDDPEGLHCQADEFLPAYFMPPGTKEKKLGQIMRWPSRLENSGAANTGSLPPSS